MLTLSSDAYDDMIQVEVGTGDNAKTFDMHKGILNFFSGYFRVAISNIESGRFAESKDGVIRLPDEDPEVFEKVKRFFYCRQLEKVMPLVDTTSFIPLCELWCFGDRREIPALQNAAISNLHWVLNKLECHPTSCLNFVYANTVEKSQLREYIIYGLATRFNRGDAVLKFREHWSMESMEDLMKALYLRPKYLSKEEFNKTDMCKHHFHEEGTRCSKPAK